MTAVEQMIDDLFRVLPCSGKCQKIKEKALANEKQQIIDAYKQGIYDYLGNEYTTSVNIDALYYYNKKFKNND